MIQNYLKKIADTTAQGDAREESYYSHLSSFVAEFGDSIGKKKIQITTLGLRSIISKALPPKYGTTTLAAIR